MEGKGREGELRGGEDGERGEKEREKMERARERERQHSWLGKCHPSHVREQIRSHKAASSATQTVGQTIVTRPGAPPNGCGLTGTCVMTIPLLTTSCHLLCSWLNYKSTNETTDDKTGRGRPPL